MKPRKLTADANTLSGTTLLQWSPGDEAEETSVTKFRLNAASGLQWSPGEEAEETLRRLRLRAAPLSAFNGAPAMKPRKPRADEAVVEPYVPLQWSPGDEAEETSFVAVPIKSSASLQWSPGDEAEETSPLSAYRYSKSSFNGAPAMKPRKPAEYDATDASGYTLQWSPGDEAEETTEPSRSRNSR